MKIIKAVSLKSVVKKLESLKVERDWFWYQKAGIGVAYHNSAINDAIAVVKGMVGDNRCGDE